jgi:type II secretory pathway pseudopilin PulG
MNQKMRKLNIRKISGYTSTGVVGIIALILFLSLIVIPRVSIFKAKGQQSEARIKLVRVYNSMYAYKLENGSFIDTRKKVISILSLRELEPYLKEDVLRFNNKNDRIYVISNQDQFAVAYIRTLANGHFDIQRINSKKSFCYMLNGIDNELENCNALQNYNKLNNVDEIKDVKKLAILGDD